MRIKNIRLKNIRSYEDQEINFSDGSLLLAGEVGSGKTSILLAMEYALFGLQPGQVGSALLRNTSQSGEVVLELEIEGHNIIIERKLKRGKTVANEYAAITIDGEKIECSITELKTKIINLLGYPSEFIKKNNLLYRYTVYTPQEQMKQIISEDAETRLNILRHIFGIDKYKTIRQNLAIFLDKLKEDSKFLQGEIISLDSDKTRLSSIKSFVTVLENKIQNQMLVFQELVLKRKSLEVESEAIEKKIKEGEKLETELEKTKVLLVSKKDALSTTTREYSQTEKTLSEDKEVFDESTLMDVVQKLDSNGKEMESLQATYIDILGKINFLNQKKIEALDDKERFLKIDFCPTCLQDVPIAHKHNILNKSEQTISSMLSELEQLEKKSHGVSDLIEKSKQEKKSLEEKKVILQILKSKIPEVEKAKTKLLDLRKNKESLEKDLSLLNKHLDGLKENIFSYSKFSNLFKAKHEEVKKSSLEEKRAEISLAELKKELELTHKEISLLQSTILEKETKKEKLLNLLELSDWLSVHFTNLISFTERSVMLRLRYEFSKLFSKWFSVLVQDSFDVQLDENFTPIIMQSGIEMNYSFLSGGERTAVALAYRLALNQTINSVLTAIKTKDIIILDEPTEGFSETQVEKIRDVLHELNAKQLIIVSHEKKIEGFVDNVIQIKKENGISNLAVPEKINILQNQKT